MGKGHQDTIFLPYLFILFFRGYSHFFPCCSSSSFHIYFSLLPIFLNLPSTLSLSSVYVSCTTTTTTILPSSILRPGCLDTRAVTQS